MSTKDNTSWHRLDIKILGGPEKSAPISFNVIVLRTSNMSGKNEKYFNIL